MIILRGITDNIIISHPSYSGVYQDEAKNEIFIKRYIFLGLEPNQKKTDKTVIHVSLSTVGLRR